MALGFPRQKPRSVLTSPSRDSPGGAPSSRLCRPGEKVVVSPLTLSVATLAAGASGFYAQILRDIRRQGRLRPPRRQALRSSSTQSAFRRRDTQPRSLARCSAGRRRRLLQPLRSTSTAPDHLKPHCRVDTSPRDDAVLLGFRPLGPSTLASRVALCPSQGHASRASSEQDQIGSRRTGAAHSRNPRGAALDVHYPAPLGSDTLCRKLVGAPAGEADTPERSRALAELTVGFSAHRRPAFARPAAVRPARAGRPARGPASHAPPRRGPRKGRAQGVFRL